MSSLMGSCCFDYYVYKGGFESFSGKLVFDELMKFLMILSLFSLEGVVVFLFCISFQDKVLLFIMSIMSFMFWCISFLKDMKGQVGSDLL